MSDDEQTQQKEQRPEATTKPDIHAQEPAKLGTGEQAAPSGVPVSPYPLPPPTVNGDGTVTIDIRAGR